MAFNPKVVDGECREFVVLPPFGAQFDEASVQNMIAEALREAFPESGFTVLCGNQALRDDEFMIVPVLPEIDGVRLARAPSPDVVAEIGSFLTVNFATIRAPIFH